MPVTTYTRTRKDPAKPHRQGLKIDGQGREQHKHTPKGLQHTDFGVTYARPEKPVDLFKQTFRVTAHTGRGPIDMSALTENLSWVDQSADTLALMNTQTPLTGSIGLRKPALGQYKHLLNAAFDARVQHTSRGAVSRYGALGAVIVCEVGYGGVFTPLWAMRVQPTQSGASGAEEVDLQDGSWTLQLADDLMLLGQSIDDFKFKKGKKQRKHGWTAHEVAVAVCRQYNVPIKRLAQGTARFELPTRDTTGVTPLEVIANAYQQEMNRTGRAFVIRWAAPDKKHPLGALEVVPLRRNPNLLTFRKQLTNAVLTRSQMPDFATVVEGRATLKGDHGKHKQITYTAHDERAIRRFGFVHKIIDFKPVASRLELEILCKRALAYRVSPLRTAELTNPGIATVRRGDAIKIDIPEEGYADAKVATYQTPKSQRKYTAVALKQAEMLDPSMFGLPDPSLLTASALAGTSTQNALTQDTPIAVPVADQSIAFVTNVTHSVSAGSYSMDMQCQFVDILDPVNMKAEMEANIRNAKAAARASSKSQSGSGSSGGTGKVWDVKFSFELASSGNGWTELSSNGNGASAAGHTQSPNCTGGSVSACDFATLGTAYAHGTELIITNPRNGKSGKFPLTDVGNGSSFAPAIGLTPAVVSALGLTTGDSHVHIQLANGGDLQVVSGFGKVVG